MTEPTRPTGPDDSAGTMGPRRQVFETEIRSLVDRIAGICDRAGIPLVAAFELDSDPEEGTVTMCTTILLGDREVNNPKMVALAGVLLTRPEPPDPPPTMPSPGGKPS
jgi:hypothetical protein